MGIGGNKILSEYEKVRIIVAFGDISGFSDFCDAVTNDEVEYDPLMRAFDQLVADTERRTGYSFTDTGDGFMCTMDIDSGNSSRVATQMVTDLWGLHRNIEAVFDVHRRESICPDGFRIVFTSGYVKRTIKKDGKILLRGKSVNQAHNYLDIARGHGLVCHETFKVLMSDEQCKKPGISFAPIKTLKKLWQIKVEEKINR